MDENFVIKALADDEMYQLFMIQILKKNDEIEVKGGKAIFDCFLTTYHGRLANPGTKPGKYYDPSKIKLAGGAETSTLGVSLPVEVVKERIKTLSDTWHLMDPNELFIEDLPASQFIESDIVKLIDTDHPEYTENLDKNQFTVYRINFDNPKEYKLRAGKLIFTANEKQLTLAADGPLRIFLGGNHPLMWRSLKAEVEFYLLIGQFKRIFNDITYSYKWNLVDAQQMVSLGQAHGIVKQENSLNLFKLYDDELGRQLAGSGLILDLTN